MRIGLSYDLKDTARKEQGAPEDALEEYDSRETVDFISAALESKGHSVVHLGGGRAFLDNVQNQQVDIVFNIAEGRGNYRGREAQIPSILEMLDIPYTGSDPLCLAVCLDKDITKRLIAEAGISTPRWLAVSSPDELARVSFKDFPFPAIIKPAYEGSSKGIRLTSMAHNASEALEKTGSVLAGYHQPVMIEEFISGEEITVGVLGSPPQVLGIMRVVPRKKDAHFIYSLEVKRDYLNLVDYECPALLEQKVLDGIKNASLSAFRALGCRDFARVDFRISPDGTPYFLEINPLAGLGSYSDLVIMAKMLGWTHEALIGAVLETALERYPQCIKV